MSPSISAAALAVWTTAAAQPLAGEHVDHHAILPAICIAHLGPPPTMTRPSRWHRLLPSVSIGFDVWTRHRSRFRRRHADVIAPSGARQQNRHRGMTRWTVDLQWNSSRPVEPLSQQLRLHDSPPVHALCAELLELQRHSPAGLAEAVDYWTDVSRLRALIDVAQTTGVADE